MAPQIEVKGSRKAGLLGCGGDQVLQVGGRCGVETWARQGIERTRIDCVVAAPATCDPCPKEDEGIPAGEGGKELTVLRLAEWVGERVAELTSDRQHPYIPLLTEFPVGRPLLYGGP